MAVPKKQSTETMSISEARKRFSEVVTRPLRGEGRVIVEKSGAPVGAIVSMEDVRRLEQLEREWDEYEDVFRRTQSGFSEDPPEVIEQEIEQAIADVEADYRAERNTEPGPEA
jgi:prevent-host-death family protein